MYIYIFRLFPSPSPKVTPRKGTIAPSVLYLKSGGNQNDQNGGFKRFYKNRNSVSNSQAMNHQCFYGLKKKKTIFGNFRVVYYCCTKIIGDMCGYYGNM